MNQLVDMEEEGTGKCMLGHVREAIDGWMGDSSTCSSCDFPSIVLFFRFGAKTFHPFISSFQVFLVCFILLIFFLRLFLFFHVDVFLFLHLIFQFHSLWLRESNRGRAKKWKIPPTGQSNHHPQTRVSRRKGKMEKGRNMDGGMDFSNEPMNWHERTEGRDRRKQEKEKRKKW